MRITMHITRQGARRAAAWVALGAASALITGCAFAPGMTFRGGCGPAGNGGAQPASCHRALAAAAPAGGGTLDASNAAKGANGTDAPPSGSLVEIDGNLIATVQASVDPSIPADVSALFAKPKPYTLGPGDVLAIVVWDHPELNMPLSQGPSTGVDNTGSNAIVSGYTVDATGRVQFAYIGPVEVGGLTELEARERVSARLGKFIRDPQVTLRIQAYRSRRIYLDGEVRLPGLQVMNDLPMTLPEAINRGGGLTAAGDRARISITRGDATAIVSLPKLVAQGINPDRILLRDGDLVRVYPLSDTKVFVLGEVGHTTTLNFNNGRLSLGEALGYAGGVSQYSADASQVYVIRSRTGTSPTIFHLDATSPVSMALANEFPLRPDDVVFVDASSLVRWSRVVGMFLPSAQTLATGRSIAY
ncbi:polysaccharide biosynthesis/export family protein [Burkholderia sp. 3C]